MLRAALNANWKTYVTNRELYGDNPQIKKKKRPFTFAGHCKRAEGCIVSELVTWRPTPGTRSKGRPKKTYTLRKPGSNIRRKGSLSIQKWYQIWAYPFRIKVIRKAGSKSLIRNWIKYFCQMILKRIKIMILNRINL